MSNHNLTLMVDTVKGTPLLQDLNLQFIFESATQLEALRREGTDAAAIRELDELKRGHQQYLELNIDPWRLLGIPNRSARPAPPGTVVLSSGKHFHARVVVAGCTDNRSTGSFTELNLPFHEVCEVTSAGHVLDDKDFESLAVGIGIKHAKGIIVKAHGGQCGAIMLALNERVHGSLDHAVTEKISQGLGEYQGGDVAQIFSGTLDNLNAQLQKILDPERKIRLLESTTGVATFYELFQQGRIFVVGAYLDFESPSDNPSLFKRLTFFDSPEVIRQFIAAKEEVYWGKDKGARVAAGSSFS